MTHILLLINDKSVFSKSKRNSENDLSSIDLSSEAVDKPTQA